MTDFVFFVFTAFVPVTGLSGSGTIRDALLVNLRHYGVPVTNMSAAVVCAEACRVASSAGKVDWRAFAPLAADVLRGEFYFYMRVGNWTDVVFCSQACWTRPRLREGTSPSPPSPRRRDPR